MGGRSTRHDRRWFGRLEQEDQRLKKHYGRWVDIIRSLELESCILTKLTKPSVPVNLVGPQVSLPARWVPASQGSTHFFVRNKEALPCSGRGPNCQPLHVQYSSNGRSASSTSGLLAPAAETSAGRASCSCLPWPAAMQRRPHRPLLLQLLANPSLYSPTPPVILRRRQPHTAAEPVNPRTPLRVGIHCRVFPGSTSSPS